MKNLITKENQEKALEEALKVLFLYSQFDGEHHKAWALDQVTRKITGENYEKFIEEYEEPLSDDPEDYYAWDAGIAP